jgi:hypothetical protein
MPAELPANEVVHVSVVVGVYDNALTLTSSHAVSDTSALPAANKWRQLLQQHSGAPVVDRTNLVEGNGCNISTSPYLSFCRIKHHAVNALAAILLSLSYVFVRNSL